MTFIDWVYGLLTFLGLGALGVTFLRVGTAFRPSGVRNQVRLFVAAFAVRFGFSILIHTSSLLQVLGDDDASGWVRGITVYEEWTRLGLSVIEIPAAMLPAFDRLNFGYGYLLAAFFYLTGLPSRMTAAVLNCFVGAVTVVLTYRITRMLYPEEDAVRAGWFMCLFPSPILWSSVTLKEPLVIFFEALAIYCTQRIRLVGFSIRHPLGVVASAVVLLSLRFYAAYIVGAVSLVSLLIPKVRGQRFGLVRGVVVAALVLPLLLSSSNLASESAKIDRYDAEFAKNFRSGMLQSGNTSVDVGYDLSTPSGLLMSMLIGGVHLLLAPFPWQLGGASLRMLLTLPEAAFWWWFFLARVVPGVRLVVREKFVEILPLVLFLGGLGFVYSATFANIGLVYRQRVQLMPMLFLFAAVAWGRRALRPVRVGPPSWPEGGPSLGAEGPGLVPVPR